MSRFYMDFEAIIDRPEEDPGDCADREYAARQDELAKEAE